MAFAKPLVVVPVVLLLALLLLPTPFEVLYLLVLLRLRGFLEGVVLEALLSLL